MYADVKNWRNTSRRVVPYDGILDIPQGSFILLDGATGNAVHFAGDWDNHAIYGFVFKGTEQNVVQIVDKLDVVLGPCDAILETDNLEAGTIANPGCVIGAELDIIFDAGTGTGQLGLAVGTHSVGYILAIDAAKGRITFTFDGVRGA